MNSKEFWKVEIADRKTTDRETFYVFATSAAEAEKKAVAFCPEGGGHGRWWKSSYCRSCEFIGYIVA